MNNRAGGFTLIELMVAIAVAAILMAIAVPSFTRFAVTSRLADQTNDLITGMNVARSEAIKRNRRVAMCRADSATATACAGGDADWLFWIVRETGGSVIRRGTINTYGNTLSVKSTLSDETMVFWSDGLARNGTGGNLVNAGLNDVGHYFSVCSTRLSTDNKRTLVLGAGSRLTTKKESGAC